MHPLVLLVPVAALFFGPQLWVKRVLKQHNRHEQDDFPSGGDLAKRLLAQHCLHNVTVESSDIGDHYDPKAKAVRLTRDKIERKTLTAITTSAHEVAHALQDASNYAPFVWRMRLVRLAQTTGQVGSVILIAVPAVSVLTRQTVPAVFIGATALAMLGTGMVAQLAALPTELDASFGRAMPLLKDGFITERQAEDARKILVASSLTYVASSLLSVMNIWPWLGWWVPVRIASQHHDGLVCLQLRGAREIERPTHAAHHGQALRTRCVKHRNVGTLASLVRCMGKPIIRSWFRVCKAT